MSKDVRDQLRLISGPPSVDPASVAFRQHFRELLREHARAHEACLDASIDLVLRYGELGLRAAAEIHRRSDLGISFTDAEIREWLRDNR